VARWLDPGTDDDVSRKPRADAWLPVPGPILVALVAFFCVFLYQLTRGGGMPPLMDDVFMPIHEAGHFLFRFFGMTASVAGGTLLQLLVPFALASYFAWQRQPQGVAFCAFFFFDQLLSVARYMADARAQNLPLITVGETDYVIHDWNYLFTKLGLLDYDVPIASIVRFVGWLGMFAVVVWLLWRGFSDSPEPARK
jgi:hypothetical protein